MRAAIYLDELPDGQGCLSVIAGSHHAHYHAQIKALELRDQPNATALAVPGRVALANRPGDVVFMNHKMFHAAIPGPGESLAPRRALHVNCVQNADVGNPAHREWLEGFLRGETEGWGRFYSDRLLATASQRRMGMLAPALALGFGNTGAGGRGGGGGTLWPGWTAPKL
jgi:hypothetical protein